MFKDSDRLIYKYHDGEGDAFADPLQINEDLVHLLDGNPDRFLEDRWAGVPDWDEATKDYVLDPTTGKPQALDPASEPLRHEARRRLGEATIKAFGLVPWSKKTGKGCSPIRALAILDAYLDWMDEQKKSTVAPPTVPAATEATSPPFPEGSTTPPTSAYGSTGHGLT